MVHPIIKEARELYYQTVQDPEYKLSHIWGKGSDNHQKLMAIIENAETPEEVIKALEKTDMYAITITSKDLFNRMMGWHVNHLQNLPYSGVIPDTPNLMKMLFYLIHIKTICGVPGSIVELGGGNGQFARIYKERYPKGVHVDIDIPESLFMAYVCTRHYFPESKVHWVTGPQEVFLAGGDFIFVPTIYAEAIVPNEFDLFINTASMGELPNETIRHWMDFVQYKLRVKYFYGLNRFLNTIHVDMKDGYSLARVNENEASVLFDSRWDILYWELEPGMCRCPWEDTRIARYLEVIAKRQFTSVSYGWDEERLRLMDWWRLRDKDPIGTHRSNQLVHDFSFKGPLYQLWDSIRIQPTNELIDMMLVYLRSLRSEKVLFEEELFYQNLRKV